jgi:hypothetical protein
VKQHVIGSVMPKRRTCDIAHAHAVYVDDVIERVNHENKAKRTQVDVTLDEGSS